MQRIHDSDSAIEADIQAKGLTAPCVTPDRIKKVIAREYYFTAADGADAALANIEYKDSFPASLHLLTFCVLVLRNGFTVTGDSVCDSPENFDAEIGRKIARENAVNKVLALEVYLLKDRMHNTPPRVDNDHVAPGCEQFKGIDEV